MILENSFGKEMMMAKIQCMAKVTEVSVLAEGIVSMWLSASGVAKSAKPGQFISLYCDNSDTLLPRPISLCEVNQKDGLLRIVFRIVGAGTKEFAAKKRMMKSGFSDLWGMDFHWMLVKKTRRQC